MLDLRGDAVEPLVSAGATMGASPGSMTGSCDVIITCLPNPEASADVLESADSGLVGLVPGKIWAEMSTTSPDEVVRLGRLVTGRGGAG